LGLSHTEQRSLELQHSAEIEKYLKVKGKLGRLSSKRRREAKETLAKKHKASVQPPEDLHEVTAIRFNGHGTHWTIWDKNNRPFQLPIKNLDGVDKDIIKEAKKRLNKRIKLTGARSEASEVFVESGDFSFIGVSLQVCEFSLAKYQASGGFCALNAVSNLFELPTDLYQHLYGKGGMFQLKDVRTVINEYKKKPCDLHRIKGVDNYNMLAYLRAQTEGKFAVEFNFGRHCVSWDADNQLIFESDPSYGNKAMKITDELLAALDIKKVECAFKIVGTKKK
jgi:hypothetical protein